MRLKNKKTGEIGVPRIEYQEIYIDTENHMTHCYKTLCGVFEEWEVYEEPKTYWHIYSNRVLENECDGIMEDWFKEIGNYFETKEEAEKVLKKLKAFKRLKDKGLKFELCPGIARGEIKYYLTEESDETEKDLRTCFGGEE